MTLASSVLAGLLCLYFSIRVGFDAAIFHQIAAAKDGPVDLQSLDDVLRELGLLPTHKVGRSVHARIVGARRLFHRQICVALLQVILIFVGAMYTVLKRCVENPRRWIITPLSIARARGRDKLPLMLREVRVRDDEIRISGSKAALARCASEGVGQTAPAVLSFVQEWRTRRQRLPKHLI